MCQFWNCSLQHILMPVKLPEVQRPLPLGWGMLFPTPVLLRRSFPHCSHAAVILCHFPGSCAGAPVVFWLSLQNLGDLRDFDWSPGYERAVWSLWPEETSWLRAPPGQNGDQQSAALRWAETLLICLSDFSGKWVWKLVWDTAAQLRG